MINPIERLLRESRKVLNTLQLDNGAIVAADTDHPAYPRLGNNYRYVWGRDAAYMIYAAELLNMKQYGEKFCHWLLTRAEEFNKKGAIYQRYATNGAIDIHSGRQFQPDQMGSLLWVLSGINSFEVVDAICLLAERICINWGSSGFVVETHDLWEERSCMPVSDYGFTYSIAACSYGLKIAGERMHKQKWVDVAEDMRKSAIPIEPGSVFSRSPASDLRIDASALGLFWPFNCNWETRRLERTLEEVENRLIEESGVKRYEKDSYGGVVRRGSLLRDGSGCWPLLTFWYTIALVEMGRKDEADEIFEDYCILFKDFLIPEQILPEDKSIKPLGWSHAMFVIAAEKLGYLS